MIDTTRLKEQVDLLSLVSRDTTLEKVATTRGGEWAGSCPFCGGTDRFHVQPEQGLWRCRQCSSGEHWQDAIAYVQKREGVPFTEAVRLLEGNAPLPARARAQPRSEEPTKEPTPEWRKAATTIVEQCEAALWSDAGSKAREWLHERGLKDETLKRWRIGLCPKSERIGGLWVERGITIPWVIEGQLWHVKIRRAVKEGEKYKSIAGGHPFLYGADTLADKRAAVLTEGEFDMMLLYQEIGHKLPDVGVATLGSATASLPAAAIRYLLPIARILVAYDMDAEGQRGTDKMMQVSARMKPVKIPMEGCKDVTDFYKAGGRLRDWIEYNIAKLDVWNGAEASWLMQQALERVAAAYERAPQPTAELDPLEKAIDDAAKAKDMPRLRRAIRDYENRALAVFA